MIGAVGFTVGGSELKIPPGKVGNEESVEGKVVPNDPELKGDDDVKGSVA